MTLDCDLLFISTWPLASLNAPFGHSPLYFLPLMIAYELPMVQQFRTLGFREQRVQKYDVTYAQDTWSILLTNSWYLYLVPRPTYNGTKCGGRVTCSFRKLWGVHRSARFENIGVSKLSAIPYKSYNLLETMRTIQVTPLSRFCGCKFQRFCFSSWPETWCHECAMYVKMSKWTTRVTRQICFEFPKCGVLPLRSLRSLTPLLSTSHDRAQAPWGQTKSYAWICSHTTWSKNCHR